MPETRADADSIELDGHPKSGPPDPASEFDVDRLNYMIDMMDEMRQMASGSGLNTLAALLTLAVNEANIKLPSVRVK